MTNFEAIFYYDIFLWQYMLIEISDTLSNCTPCIFFNCYKYGSLVFKYRYGLKF